MFGGEESLGRLIDGFNAACSMMHQFDSRQVRAPRNISSTTMTKVKPGHYLFGRRPVAVGGTEAGRAGER